MAETVGQHSVAAFTSPVNGTSPIDANTVKGNDNTIRSAYVDHDADPGIHVQSSTLASRPTANSAGRKWMTADSGVIRLFYDDGTNWYEADYLRTTGGTISGNLAVTGTLGVTGVTTLTAQPILSSLTASQAVFTDASKGLVSNAITGTGNVVMSASPTLTGTIQAAAANLSGALGVSGLLTFASLKGTGATTVTNILDEDNMASDSATALATQQSIKAYVDAQIVANNELSEVLANGNTTGANDIIVSTGQKIRTPAVAAGDGSPAITIANTSGALTFAAALADSNLATISTAGKVANSATTATDANTASAIVARDASGNFSAGTITAALTGNASTATALQTARTINGTSFDGTANITVTAAAGTLTGTTLASNVVSSSLTSVGTLANLTVTNPISGSVTGSSGSTTGNAATATALQTARNINGVSFNGTADITVTAAAGTLTGTTLASGVTASSLTSVGTLTSLTVSGSARIANASGNKIMQLGQSTPSANDASSLEFQASSTQTNWAIRTNWNVAGALEFNPSSSAGGTTYTTPSMLLTSSGNLGLGVTPSYQFDLLTPTSATDRQAVRINYGTSVGRAVYFGIDAAVTGTTYIQSATPSSVSSGTDLALNPKGGNVGVGTTSPAARFEIAGTTAFNPQQFITNTDVSVGGKMAGLYFYSRAASNGWYSGIDAYVPSGSPGVDRTDLRFYTTSGTTAERARITSGGDFCVNATSGNGRLSVRGPGTTTGYSFEAANSAGTTRFIVQDGGLIQFLSNTGGTESGRFTTGGYFKASNNGTYANAAGAYHELRNTSSGDWTFRSTHSAASPYGIYISFSGASPNGTGNEFLYCEDSTGQRATFRSNGGLANYSANNVNLASDERLKKDIAPLTSTWDKLKAIEVVNFRYKDCNEDDPALYGVIAQQVQPIVPELVVVTREAVEAKDAVLDEDGNEVKPAVEAAPEYYGIREQPMYWLAIKALQEAQARIEALEARLEALEA